MNHPALKFWSFVPLSQKFPASQGFANCSFAPAFPARCVLSIILLWFVLRQSCPDVPVELDHRGDSMAWVTSLPHPFNPPSPMGKQCFFHRRMKNRWIKAWRMRSEVFIWNIAAVYNDWCRTWEKSGEFWGLGDLNQPLQEIMALKEEWQSHWFLVTSGLAFSFALLKSQNTRLGFQEDTNSGWKEFPNWGQRVGLEWGLPLERCRVGNFVFILGEQTWELRKASLTSRNPKRSFSSVCSFYKIPSICSEKQSNPKKW